MFVVTCGLDFHKELVEPKNIKKGPAMQSLIFLVLSRSTGVKSSS